MSAEEYAARNGRDWWCFSYGEYVYPDPALNEWIRSLDDILFSSGRLQEAERKYLTADELRAMQRERTAL
jgi:hypothetical protein